MPSNRIWPLVRLDLPGDQPQQRRLAGAARPHDRRDAAARNRQVQTGEDRAAADRVVNVADFDDACRGRGSRQALLLRSIGRHSVIRSPGAERSGLRPLPVPASRCSCRVRARPLNFARREERLLAGGEVLRLAAPRLQRFVLQRAAVARTSAAHGSGPSLFIRLRCSVASAAALAARQERDARHRAGHVALERTHRRFGDLLRDWRACAAFLPEMTMLGLRIMPSR